MRILERRACLLYSLGLWWRTYALLHHSEQERAFNLAKDYFQQCIELFEQASRKDLVAKFINVLGSVLQSLQSWQELETVANKALALHKIYPNQFKTARAYGFLAEVAIANGTIIKTFNQYRNGVNSVSFSLNGKMIASGSQDKIGTVIWSLDGTRTVKVYDADSVNSISFSPDSQVIASASKKTVKLWNIDGTLPTNFQHFGSYDVSFSPDGKSIAAIGDGKILVWDFDLKELLKRGCEVAHDYLKNNPKTKSDRYLCDDIYKKK
ncbi:hypothetical protein [Nostoc sp. 'Lobaria pulmonaria (5183) cyanobiont']|uniref:hypothetical protein n=1 Tax=Nostoc sp. 'Lobaria pulmonaria (5183) cyanobiont' TaxID=1618022 RepID=UPI00131A368D|nr:hypothetical protein [Nostoc sp. 'Lobaria pulmonaria (5183) cyanobiont']